MISTKNPSALPDKEKLRSVCKAISVLDAILCQDWELRYYSYNAAWAEKEEFFEMRDGQGDHLLVLFRPEGAVMNGAAHEFDQEEKTQLTKGLPALFNDFIYNEPMNTIGTTFCMWTNENKEWQVGNIQNFDDASEEMLTIFDGNPQTYIDWAEEYFEEEYKETGIPLGTVKDIYAGKMLTKKMVFSIVDELEDWEQLEQDLKEIDYPYDFK